MKEMYVRKVRSVLRRKIYPFFKKRVRVFLSFSHDIFVTILSLQVSIFLRMGDDFSQISLKALAFNSCLYVVFGALVFLSKHVYRGMWKYASLGDLVSISLSVTYITFLYVSVMFFLPLDLSLPRSTPLINWFVLTAFLGAPRILYRMYCQYRNKKPSLYPLKPKTALIIGSGDQTELFIRETLRQNDNMYEFLGIIGYKNVHKGQKIHHIPVIGTISEIPTFIDRFKKKDTPVDMLIVADQHLNGKVIKSLVALANSLDLRLARLPHISEITDPTEGPRVRPVAIEDLLGRPQTRLDRESMHAMIKGKRILVTGAGGTIGGELVRQISNFHPSHICLVDNSEYLLYTASSALSEHHPALPIQKVLADVACREKIHHVISSFKPELVFHAAALKHVPLVEENPAEGCLTNVIGTRNVADACRESGVKAMLLISTDKAINPSSVMGATKRLAESYCQALDILEHTIPHGTSYVSVRFGNVLGSSGSVVPLFKRQIEKGGPITLTHPDMTRYFMTAHEAVELVLQAMAFALTSQIKAGGVFVLDMGEPVKILDMATQMITLAGLKPDIDIEIKYIGLRPGEKLFEELFHASEHLLPTNNASIFLGAPRTSNYEFLSQSLQELEHIAKSQDTHRLLSLLQTLVPEYASSNPNA
jgi:O-antigen biosynthesis protein WbqV